MKKDKVLALSVILMTLLSFACLTFNVAYSWVNSNKVTNSGASKTITTGNLNTTVTYTSTSLGDMEIMSDDEGIAQEAYSKISITKNNVYSVYYTIHLGYNYSSVGTSEYSTLLPLEYVKVALFKMSGTTVSSTPIAGPVSIAELPLFTVTSTSQPYQDTYVFATDIFDNASNSQSATYALKAWLDGATPDSYDGYYVYLKAGVRYETLISKSIYNISGTVKANGTASSGAVVSLVQNTAKTSTSTSAGAYTLSNVPEGIYTLNVKIGGVNYRKTVQIVGDVTTTGGTVTNSTACSSCTSGTYLQNTAYTYNLSPKEIMNKNPSVVTNSNSSASVSYTLPTSYKIHGLDTISVTNLTGIILNVNTTTGEITISK